MIRGDRTGHVRPFGQPYRLCQYPHGAGVDGDQPVSGDGGLFGD